MIDREWLDSLRVGDQVVVNGRIGKRIVAIQDEGKATE